MAAGGGDDAEGAAVPAAILHFEVGTGLAAADSPQPLCGMDNSEWAKVSSTESGSHRSGLQSGRRAKGCGHLRDKSFMTVADDGVRRRAARRPPAARAGRNIR